MNATAETLTQGELSIDAIDGRFAIDMTDDRSLTALPPPTVWFFPEHAALTYLGWKELSSLETCDELVWLHLGDAVIVEGWKSTRFLGGKPTFWTWDEPFARVSQVQPVFPGDGVSVLPACVEPVAWAERTP